MLGLEQMFECLDVRSLPYCSFTKITIRISILLHQAMFLLYQAVFLLYQAMFLLYQAMFLLYQAMV